MIVMAPSSPPLLATRQARRWRGAAFAGVLAASAAAAVLGGASPAAGYVRTTTTEGAPAFWNRTIMTIVAYVGDPPPFLSADEIMNATRGAAAAWSRGAVGCTGLELRIVSSTEASALVEPDSVSRLTFRRAQWCREPRGLEEPCYDPNALALTSVFVRKADGRIVDADVEVNAVDFKWLDLMTRPRPGDRSEDLQNALTHEFGHLIGLDHTCVLPGVIPRAPDDQGRDVPQCLSASPAIRETTMFAAVDGGDVERRTLSDDDRRALCEIYPPQEGALESVVGAGCAVASARPGAGSQGGRAPDLGGPAGLSLLVGLALATVRACRTARRRRSPAAPPEPPSRSSTRPWRRWRAWRRRAGSSWRSGTCACPSARGPRGSATRGS